MRHRLQTTFTLFAIWLTACLPLLRGHLPWRGDGILHVYRLAHLQRAVVNGDLYPRWLPDLALGHGFPLFNYYAPLSYYIALPFTWVTTTETSLRLSYILALCVTGLATYTWSRRIWQLETAALLSSLVAVYSPYILYNIHERGAFAEAWGIALIAASFSAVDALIRNPNRRNWLMTTLAVAGLLLIHNISALIAAPLLALYVLWQVAVAPAKAFERGGWGMQVFSAALCAIGLTTFFWLPALREQNLVQIGRLTQDPALDFRNHFQTVATLFAWPQSADPTQVNPPIPFGLSLPAFVLALFALLSSWRRREVLLLGLMTVALICLTVPLAQPIWETLPLVEFIQFPWRLNGIISLLVAVLAGGAFSARMEVTKWAGVRLSVLALVVLGYGMFWLFPARWQSPLDLSVSGSIEYELASGALGTTSSADYLPVAVQTLPDPTNRRLITMSDAQITETPHYLGTAADVSHNTSWQLVYEQFYYAGWEATLDGEPLELYPAAESGLISAEIPAGTHTLAINWHSTPIRRVSELISVAFLIVACIFLVTIKSAPSIALDYQGRGMNAFVAVALAVALSKITVLNNSNNLWHNPRFDGQMVRGADFSADSNFQNTLTLVGYDLPSAPIPADQPIPLTLYLQATSAVDFDPAISVHLVDEQGRFFGQSDHYRPANFPINRWQQNEYAADSHQLQPLDLTPPGSYIVRLFILNDQSGARLNVLNAAGQPIGNSVDLGTITLERGVQNVASSEELLGQSAEITVDMEGVLPPAQVGDTLSIVLYWGALIDAPSPQPTQFVLSNKAGEVVAMQPLQPLNPNFPLDKLRASERWRDPQAFRVPPTDQSGEPLTTGRYTLSIAIGETLIPLRGSLAVTAPDRTFEIPPIQHSVNAALGDAVTLLGYDLTDETLTLYWQAAREFTTSYQRFVHLLDENGTILAQNDAVPGRATTGWISAEIITDTLLLPHNASATHLAIGLYDPQIAIRLAEPLILPLK